MYDILIKNGMLYDGTGQPGFTGDIAVTGERIAKVAPSIDGPAKLVIDAGGKAVMPGLIDPHTHEEWVLLSAAIMSCSCARA